MPMSLRFSSLLLASVLVSPHLTVYDLVVLAPAILLLADWLIDQPPTPSANTMGTILYLVYALPLVGPLALWTHVQLSVIAMAIIIYSIWKSSSTVIESGGDAHPGPDGRELKHKSISTTPFLRTEQKS